MNFSDWYSFIEALEMLSMVLMVSFVCHLHQISK